MKNWLSYLHGKLFVIFLLFFCLYTQNLSSAPTEILKQSEKPVTILPNTGLNNFLISGKEKEEWTRLMLAIQKSFDAVRSLLNEGISPRMMGDSDARPYFASS